MAFETSNTGATEGPPIQPEEAAPGEQELYKRVSAHYAHKGIELFTQQALRELRVSAEDLGFSDGDLVRLLSQAFAVRTAAEGLDKEGNTRIENPQLLALVRSTIADMVYVRERVKTVLGQWKVTRAGEIREISLDEGGRGMPNGLTATELRSVLREIRVRVFDLPLLQGTRISSDWADIDRLVRGVA